MMTKDDNPEAKQLSIRIPWELRMKLKAVADGQGRSLNAEIVRRLKHTLSLDEIKTSRVETLDETMRLEFYSDDVQISQQILDALRTIDQKLDYMTSETHNNTVFVNLINYLSRKL